MALPMDTCGNTLSPGTPRLGGRNTAFPSTCGSSLRGTWTSAVGGTGRHLDKTFFLHCQRRHSQLPKILTYLPQRMMKMFLTFSKQVVLLKEMKCMDKHVNHLGQVFVVPTTQDMLFIHQVVYHTAGILEVSAFTKGSHFADGQMCGSASILSNG